MMQSDGLIEAYTPKEVQTFLIQKGLPGTILLLDIDDTIITPLSKTFRSEPYRRLIDDIKHNQHLYENYETIVSHWRLQRKIQLVDNTWPEIITELKQQFRVFGLTKLNTGPFGDIPSMEQWRYNELIKQNIAFTQPETLHSTNSRPNALEAKDNAKNSPQFIKGILMTGETSKSETLEYFKDTLNPHHVILVDDRKEHLFDVKQYCEKNNILFSGILFKGMERLRDTQDPRIAEFQKTTLLNKAVWLEDEDVRKILNLREEI